MSNENFYHEMNDILNPHIDIETGSDDFIYGNYVEWPDLKSLEDDQIKELLFYFGIEIPFGETKDIYIEDIKSTVFGMCNSNKKNLNFIKSASIVLNDQDVENQDFIFRIKIPELSHVKEKICDLLRKYGVPEGTEYENGGMNDYPNSFKYFYTEDDEYLFYKEFGIEHNKYRIEILKILDMINNQSNELVKKSLLLTAFIYTESYVKSIIVNKIPDKDSLIINKQFKNIIGSYITKNLQKTSGRQELFKKFCLEKLPKIPNIELRNILAHDIDAAKLEEDIISFSDKSENMKTKNISINEIFKELQDFSDVLESLCYR